MKDGVGECLCLGDRVTTTLVVQQNRLSLVVVSDGPSSQLRAVDQSVSVRQFPEVYDLFHFFQVFLGATRTR